MITNYGTTEVTLADLLALAFGKEIEILFDGGDGKLTLTLISTDIDNIEEAFQLKKI